MARQNFYVGGIPFQKGPCYPVMSYQPFKDLGCPQNSHYQTVWARRQLEGGTENTGISKGGIVLGCLRKGRLQPFLTSPGEKVGRPGVYT